MTNPADHFPDTRREEQELTCTCGWVPWEWARIVDPECKAEHDDEHGKRGDANAGGNHVSSDVAEPRSGTENVSSKEVADLLESHLDRYGSAFEALSDAPGPSDRLEEGFLSVALSHFRLAVEQDHDVTLSPRHAGAVLAEIDRLRAEYKAMKEAGQGTLARQWAEIVKLRKALGEK